MPSVIDYAIWGTSIVSVTNDVYFNLSLSKKIKDGLIRRAVGRYNQRDVHLAIVKWGGSENWTLVSQPSVCKIKSDV